MEYSKNKKRNGVLSFLEKRGYKKQQQHAIINYYSGADIGDIEETSFTERCVKIQEEFFKFITYVDNLK